MKAVVNIIGFDLDGKSKEALEKVSKAGGGAFQAVDSDKDFDKAFDHYIESLKKENGQWFNREITKLKNNYNSDSSLIDDLHKQVVLKVKKEHARLLNAFGYLSVTKKIDSKKWVELAQKADSRWSDLGEHMDSQFSSGGDNVTGQWNDLVRELDSQFYKNKRKLTNSFLNGYPPVRLPENNVYRSMDLQKWFILPARFTQSPPETLEKLKKSIKLAKRNQIVIHNSAR
ncbi:hypothetical protein EDD57_11125 [Baia soyae]|uniref:Uncharacterized protein n=1 Tax=Baia soyae TaxID=1544746 RepID=A0A4R2RZV9_9BACL|nr:hypothetical protein EDD57_11125 [Baia soyae]